MKSLPFISLLLLLNLACKKQETVTQSNWSNPNTSASSCNIGKWPTLPLTLKLSSEFLTDFPAPSPGALNPLEQMAKAWNDAVTPSIGLITTPFTATSSTGFSSLGQFRDNELGIYKSHTWFSGVSSNALAITQFFGNSRTDANLGNYIELTHADIIFNYRDFGSSFAFNRNPIDYDVPSVLIHEMGHFLGLCHESVRPSIMGPYYVGVQRSLLDWDSNKIRGLYLNNQNISAISSRNLNAISVPDGTEVRGIVELNANGICRHYINGKIVYEHMSSIGVLPGAQTYKNLPLR